MAETILQRLAKGDLLVSDGATGSYLQQHGLEDGDPEEWNVSHPEVVQGMAKAYFDAGLRHGADEHIRRHKPAPESLRLCGQGGRVQQAGRGTRPQSSALTDASS